MHDRRSALRLAFGGFAALCPLCRSADAAEVKWEYQGELGPQAWGKLSPEFQACSMGREQTPIDLKDGIKAEPGMLSFAYKRMPVRILNNGHTIQVNCPAGSQVEIAGQTYDLLQYHFHHPSEHILSGQRFQLELHFVHKNKAGELAVVGVFIRPGQANPALQSLWSVMPAKAAPEKWTSVSLNPDRLLPANSTYFRYHGSLTTPPCSEGVLWTVYRESIEASEAQIRQFAQLFPNNSRPIQPLNRRFLLATG
ncbi:MAG: carbonic anhydrase [Alphaproteobacteria bacterium]|nr:carbonic anhydrase [Alphaproteobacteria bacterium]